MPAWAPVEIGYGCQAPVLRTTFSLKNCQKILKNRSLILRLPSSDTCPVQTPTVALTHKGLASCYAIQLKETGKVSCNIATNIPSCRAKKLLYNLALWYWTFFKQREVLASSNQILEINSNHIKFIEVFFYSYFTLCTVFVCYSYFIFFHHLLSKSKEGNQIYLNV